MLLLDITENVTERKNDYSPEYHMVAVRGFVMLLTMQEMEIFNNFHDVFERMIELFARSQNALRTQFDGKYANFAADLIGFCVPKDQMAQIIQKFQLYITIVIMNKIFK